MRFSVKCYLFAFQVYDHSPKVLRIVYATKVQLDLEYGTANNVAMFTIKSSIFSPAFSIAYALH